MIAKKTKERDWYIVKKKEAFLIAMGLLAAGAFLGVLVLLFLMLITGGLK